MEFRNDWFRGIGYRYLQLTNSLAIYEQMAEELENKNTTNNNDYNNALYNEKYKNLFHLGTVYFFNKIKQILIIIKEINCWIKRPFNSGTMMLSHVKEILK